MGEGFVITLVIVTLILGALTFGAIDDARDHETAIVLTKQGASPNAVRCILRGSDKTACLLASQEGN